jgi:very-short-patch-repair endonuclease
MTRRGLRLKTEGALQQDESAHRLLAFQLKAAGHARFEVEHRFAAAIGRQWQWDIAFLPEKLAVEVDGGIWVRGAHGHPTTILRNMEKRNMGAWLGWRLLSFSTDDVKSGAALSFIESVLTRAPAPVAPGETHVTGYRTRSRTARRAR